jgi:hypothetical protein
MPSVSSPAAPPQAPSDGVLSRLRQQRIVDTADLAELLDCHEDTIRIWARTGKLPPALPCSRKRLKWDMERVVMWLGLNTGGGDAV